MTATVALNPPHHLATGRKATIAGLPVSHAFSHRLGALGLRVGEMIEVVRRAPFAGPLHLRIGTTDVIMRRQDAAGITVVFA